MVVGHRHNGMTSNVEVLSLDLGTSSVPECMCHLNDVPSNMKHASGGLTQDGRPFVCGGYYNNKCFVNHPNDSWVESGRANTTRSWVGADYSAEFGGLVIAGGHIRRAGRTDIVELTADGESFESLVPLPAANEGLCLVITGNDSLFIAGGQTEDGLTSHAYTYVIGNKSWTHVSNMGSASRNHRCGLIYGREGKEVVVAGLELSNNYWWRPNIVEIYNLANGIWRSAPSINFNPYYSSIFSYGNSFALVGGWYMGDGVSAWTYDESNGVWYGLTDRMEGFSSGMPAIIPVNEDMFHSCQGEFACLSHCLVPSTRSKVQWSTRLQGLQQ